jgi:hypothetical protein
MPKEDFDFLLFQQCTKVEQQIYTYEEAQLYHHDRQM